LTGLVGCRSLRCTWIKPGSFPCIVFLPGWVTGGVIEGFARTAVVAGAVGGPVHRCVLLVFLFAAFDEGLVGLALPAAELGSVALESS